MGVGVGGCVGVGIEGRAQNIAPLQVGGIVAIEGIEAIDAIDAIVGIVAMETMEVWGKCCFLGKKGEIVICFP